MKKQIVLAFCAMVLLGICIPFKGNAQGSATGCYLPSTNRVYTFNVFGSGYYTQTPSVGLSTNYCSWGPSGGTPCTICNNGVNVVNGVGSCNGANPQIFGTGFQNTYTMQECPVDQGIPMVLGTIILLVAIRCSSQSKK